MQNKILTRRTFRDDFGADAGIAWLQRAVFQAWPITADGGVETIGPARIDRVVQAINPLDIRSEAGLAAEIDGEMHAEAARHMRQQPGGIGRQVDADEAQEGQGLIIKDYCKG